MYCKLAENCAYHGQHTSDSLKCVVQSTIGHLNKHLLDRLVVVTRVHTLRCSELLSYTAKKFCSP